MKMTTMDHIFKIKKSQKIDFDFGKNVKNSERKNNKI